MTKCKIRTDHEKVTRLMWKLNITPNCHSYYRSWRLGVSCASCIWCEVCTIMSTTNEYRLDYFSGKFQDFTAPIYNVPVYCDATQIKDFNIIIAGRCS